MRSRLPSALALAVLLAPAGVAARTIESYAFVREDATLEVSNEHIRLYGVYVPETAKTCRTYIHPVRCSSKAALALEFRIQGFVRCETVQRYNDRSYAAVCFHDGQDLGAYLISKGLAVATPDAPFDYKVRERIAREQSRGVWGFDADAITKQR
jgi:endonuclease YncB( thermonuclease family)